MIISTKEKTDFTCVFNIDWKNENLATFSRVYLKTLSPYHLKSKRIVCFETSVGRLSLIFFAEKS